MKNNFINTEHIEGRVYQHELSLKTVKTETSPNFGKPFISGTLDIATDEEGLNIITINFVYETEFTKKGAKSPTYANLNKIIEEGKCWITDGKDAATKVKIDTSLALNDFYGRDDQLVSVKTNSKAFVTIVNDLCPPTERNQFSMDMLISSIVPIEKENDMYLVLRGAVFDYMKRILPVDFCVKNPAGIKYFENAEITNANPMFTKVWGKIVSTTSYREEKEETAFGEAAIKKYERKTKEWVVTGTSRVPYDFGDENVLTSEDIVTAMQNREVYLAEVKQRNLENRATKVTPAAGGAADFSNGLPHVKTGTFSF